MNNELMMEAEEHSRHGKLRWAAVLGGVFGSMGIGVLLALLGLGLGLAVFKANASAVGALSIGSVIWFVISGVIAMFVCGWIAGIFARTRCLLKGILHGLLAWSLATLIGVAVVNTGVGVLVVGAGQVIGRTLSIAGQGFAAAVPKVAQGVNLIAQGQGKQIKSMGKQINQLLLNQTGGMNSPKGQVPSTDDWMNAVLNPQSELQGNIIQAFKAYIVNTDPSQQAKLRQAVVDQLTKNTNLTQDQAGQVVDKWQKQYQQLTQQLKAKAAQAKQKAQAAAEQASTQLSKAAFFSFFVLLLGACATVLGSWLGVRSHQPSRKPRDM